MTYSFDLMNWVYRKLHR